MFLSARNRETWKSAAMQLTRTNADEVIWTKENIYLFIYFMYSVDGTANICHQFRV